MAKLGDFIREECHPLGARGAQDLLLIGVSNEHGLHPSSRDTSDDLSRYQRIERDWFAYNPMRVNVGSIGLADDETKTGFTSPDYAVFSCRPGLDPHYLLHFLKSDYGLEEIARHCSGAVRKRLYYSGLAEIELPIPSLDEQRVLVARIHGISETIRFIREENSDRHELPLLKQAILQEAIQGKLTADWRAANPDVEPASQLLQRIKAERARLVATGKLRPEKPALKVAKAEVPFDIPETWEWHRLGELGLWCGGGTPTKGEDRFWGNEVPWITPKDMKKPFLDDSSLKLTRTGVRESSAKLIPPKSILFVVRGMILIHTFPVSVNLVETTVNQDMKALIPFVSGCEAFLLLLLQASSQRVLRLVTKSTHGTRKLETDVYENLAIPIPSFAEQTAIVERVEALMTTCRALQAEIEHSRTHAAHLLQAILKEAFAPASTRG